MADNGEDRDLRLSFVVVLPLLFFYFACLCLVK